MSIPPLLELLIISIAASRISFSITSERLFLPFREWVWSFSAPLFATNDAGDSYSMYHVQKFGKKKIYSVKLLEDDTGNTVGYDHRKAGFLGKLIECPLCLGFWISLAFYVSILILPVETMLIAGLFFVWAVQTAINEWIIRG